MGYRYNPYAVPLGDDDTGVLQRRCQSCGERAPHAEETILGDRVLRCMDCGHRRAP